MKYLVCAGVGLAALSACAPTYAPVEGPAPAVPASVSTTLVSPTGQTMGTAAVQQVGDSLRVTINGMSLPAGAHGAHVHQTGLCTPPTFESAGGHWNPTGQEHGKDNPAGMHMGDLPNILIGTDGRGTLEYTIPMARMGDLMDGDGAAVVVHAQPDDYRTDPSGSSGARIACGVLG